MTYPNRTVFDVETTIVDGDPSVFGGAKLVMVGALRNGDHPCTYDGMTVGVGAKTVLGTADTDILVAHNIAFDLQHLWAGTAWPDIQKFVKQGHGIWDTQIAEYILSGQQVRMARLDDLTRKYGGVVKNSIVTDAFERGEGADTIDPDLLREYLIGDLENTDLIFKHQWSAAAVSGQTALILAMGRARLCTALMQYAGISVDVDAMMRKREELEEKRVALESALAVLVRKELHRAVPLSVSEWHLPYTDAELVTDQWMGWYLFGGTATFDYKVQAGVYKSGKKAGSPRYTSHVAHAIRPGSHYAPEATKVSSRFTRVFQLDDDVLSGCSDALPVAKDILELRRVKKLLGTYIDGILKNTKTLRGYAAVHPNFNHALTATGRLSCSNPNLQNQDEVSKEFFVPDPGTGSVFMEFDFKQLEVCALAHLSGDPQLISDLCNGVDLHFETGKEVFGWRIPSDMDDKTRRGVKGVNFGLIYGGSAKGLAKTTGFPVATVEKLIKAFYSRYPVVKTWQEFNRKVVDLRREYDGVKRTAGGRPAGEGGLFSPCGRLYVFTEYDAPDWLVERGTLTSFSPTEIKNYPVQGFATGDIVPIALAVLVDLWAEQPNHTNWIPRLTVHDSMKLSVRKGKEAEVEEMMQCDLLPRVFAVLKEVFGVELVVPLVLDCKVGDRWSTLTKYKP